MNKEFYFRIVLASVVFFLVYYFGIKPYLFNDGYSKTNQNVNWAKSRITEDAGKYDVIVVGEEPDGIAAALSASRLGAKTLLISESEDLGGKVLKSMWVDMEVNHGLEGEILNRGILLDFYKQIGDPFSYKKYTEYAEKVLSEQKKLEIIRDATIETLTMEENKIIGINLMVKGKKNSCYGRIIIDATSDGKVLLASKVPFVSGSEDINLKGSYMPVSLNFEIAGVDYKDVKSLVTTREAEFLKELSKFSPTCLNIVLNGINPVDQGDGHVVIEGVTYLNLDVLDDNKVAEAYQEASKDATALADFLKAKFVAFEKMEFVGVADEFIIKEKRHFIGEYVLSVNDVLENCSRQDKIAVGNNPVLGGKLIKGYANKIIIGRPTEYDIPLGCIIPKNVDNLLMTGSKASYSSLAASSTSTMSLSLTTGESAGVFAVYSAYRKMAPREVLNEDVSERKQEFQKLLVDNGLYLPENKSTKSEDTYNYSYSAVRKLRSLGLVYAGDSNNLKFNEEAKQIDLARLLLNGVYRNEPSKYSLELDARLRGFFVQEKLSKEKACEILASFYGKNVQAGSYYDYACTQGWVDSLLLGKFVKKDVLQMEDLYYLSVRAIEEFTGKTMPE